MSKCHNARLDFAIRLFNKHGIEFSIKSRSDGHFHCRQKSNDRLWEFWSDTGKIKGLTDKVGVYQLVAILDDFPNSTK